jgi:hypothetical protein
VGRGPAEFGIAAKYPGQEKAALLQRIAPVIQCLFCYHHVSAITGEDPTANTRKCTYTVGYRTPYNVYP